MSNGIRPKQHARLGIFYLEESVLDVLLRQSTKENVSGQPRSAGALVFFRSRGTIDAMNDAIVHGILVKLADEHRVQRCTQTNDCGGWEMTDKEFTERRDDVGLN